MAAVNRCMLHCVPLLNNNPSLISLSPSCISTTIEYISKYITLNLQPYKSISDSLKHLINDYHFSHHDNNDLLVQPAAVPPLSSTPSTSSAADIPVIPDIVCHLQCYKKFCHKKTLTQARKRKVGFCMCAQSLTTSH